ncbi:hypothetical protein MIB43_004660 [Providencia rettgeri]|uniref:phage tail fiber protein n=1 Tax=Providencia rettgeri TaxID=587 RepID=UPI001F042EE0|nr:hypothetical protein [Providencia rettgeri]MCG9949211.1 hypothetical protein [Providencia rettgeri]
MIYEIGTISTKANDPKITGKNTLWKNSVTKVSVGQIILIQSGNAIYQNSIRSVESDTQMTLSFPVPVALTDVKYVISITMIGSVSDGVNKATAMVTESYQLMMILNRLMTEFGVIKVVLPDGTEMQLRTEKERDRLLDGKFDKNGGDLSGNLKATGSIQTSQGEITAYKDGGSGVQISGSGNEAVIKSRSMGGAWQTHIIPNSPGTLMQVGDYGFGSLEAARATNSQLMSSLQSRFFKMGGGNDDNAFVNHGAGLLISYSASIRAGLFINDANGDLTVWRSRADIANGQIRKNKVYTDGNTTKDSNGNLKAASPIVKLFADDIELNEESEGVEMEHLGIGHYLIKGVVGFNADGAWGINNGFVIPQDHNGKNMVLIDYEVRPDGDIEVFVFHQQNADMPERFQNKRIKHFDEEGVPVYFENYEPCDVPESRWIDMRVEMPSNSLYNQKQAEAERLAKLETERLAEEEAKCAAEEAERAEQEDQNEA